MAVNSQQIGALLRPGLQRVLAGHSHVRFTLPRRWPPGWLEQYRTAYETVVTAERWQRWLAKHTPTVRERLERLNPNGVTEGSIPRGWQRKWSRHDEFTRDLVTVAKYQEKWGRWPDRIAYKRGRRKYVTRAHYLDGTAHETRRCPNENCCMPYGHEDECIDAPF